MAIAYSLTAELALTASSRSDLAASRQAESDSAARAKERHTRASSELATFPRTRTVGELEALIAKQSRQGCQGRGEAERAKWVCPVSSSLLGELARAKRRQELEAVLNGADQTLGASSHATVADPGSAALVTYLGAIGLVASSETVAQWLALVPVVALELGSALASLLVQAVAPARVQGESVRNAATAGRSNREGSRCQCHRESPSGLRRGSKRQPEKARNHSWQGQKYGEPCDPITGSVGASGCGHHQDWDSVKASSLTLYPTSTLGPLVLSCTRGPFLDRREPA